MQGRRREAAPFSSGRSRKPSQTSTPAPSTFAVMAESAEQAVPCADLPLEQRVEAVLMVADRPMSEGRIAELLGIIDAAPVRRRRKKAETAEGDTPACLAM